MHQTKKGNQWYFADVGPPRVDAGTGYAHSVTATAANVHDLAEIADLVRADDEVVSQRTKQPDDQRFSSTRPDSSTESNVARRTLLVGAAVLRS